MKNGIIKINSDKGKTIGFTSDKFGGYLWKKENVITISLIQSKKRGNFKWLIKKIKSLGYVIDIPSPIGRMQKIVEKHGFLRHQYSKDMDAVVEIWRLS